LPSILYVTGIVWNFVLILVLWRMDKALFTRRLRRAYR
jgi:hypothetical protein